MWAFHSYTNAKSHFKPISTSAAHSFKLLTSLWWTCCRVLQELKCSVSLEAQVVGALFCPFTASEIHLNPVPLMPTSSTRMEMEQNSCCWESHTGKSNEHCSRSYHVRKHEDIAFKLLSGCVACPSPLRLQRVLAYGAIAGPQDSVNCVKRWYILPTSGAVQTHSSLFRFALYSFPQTLKW